MENNLNVRIILSDEAPTPKYVYDGDAGIDIEATGVSSDGDVITYRTGLKIEIPKGYVGLIYPRSSLSKYDLTLCNSVGVIDSGYQGEILFKFRLTKDKMFAKIYETGDRVGQIMIVPYPKVSFQKVHSFDEVTERGDGGFGSSDENLNEE